MSLRTTTKIVGSIAAGAWLTRLAVGYGLGIVAAMAAASEAATQGVAREVTGTIPPTPAERRAYLRAQIDLIEVSDAIDLREAAIVSAEHPST